MGYDIIVLTKLLVQMEVNLKVSTPLNISNKLSLYRQTVILKSWNNLKFPSAVFPGYKE